MPPVSQFPPARVFLKNAASTPSPITISTSRRASLTSPLSPRYTTSSSNASQSMAQMLSQRSSAREAQGSARRVTN
ncbi:hypothetical protein AG0111_0g2980 [Alternaria gaisen]|uniref:Uncharacterized protein n=1 Tax=Alternaria gaisen TaxID=167740 RepID=A0ACB6FVG6_9PLEO|nr:hypothetical protein AG0111_0g2980 [Alternaria gaisen]